MSVKARKYKTPYRYEKDTYRMPDGCVGNIELELSTACNLQCPLCVRNYTAGKNMMKKPLFRPLTDIINHLDKFKNIDSITLAGMLSEPTLFKDFIPLVEYIIKRGISLQIYTNGDTHDIKWWNNLGAVMVDNVNVYFTITGSTQKLHEIYRIKSSLENILKNAESFRASSRFQNDILQYIRFEYNKDDVDNIYDIVSRFSGINIIDSLPYGERFELTKEAPVGVSIDPKLKSIYKSIKKTGNVLYEMNKKKENITIDCVSAMDRSIFIDTEGKESPCFLWRMNNPDVDWNREFKDIFDFKYRFCYECEHNISNILQKVDGLGKVV